jgi:hypothetical protein
MGAEVTQLAQLGENFGRTLEFDLDFVSHIESLEHW